MYNTFTINNPDEVIALSKINTGEQLQSMIGTTTSFDSEITMLQQMPSWVTMSKEKSSAIDKIISLTSKIDLEESYG